MKLENQVCSLELAKKLKKLGVKQHAYWTWYENSDTADLIHNENGCRPFENKSFDAFTVAELGELLPAETHSLRMKGHPNYLKNKNRFSTANPKLRMKHGDGVKPKHADTEADSRAKMLSYLLEKKLIKVNLEI